MEPFLVHRGLVAPLSKDNIDTDAIIPKQFLKSIKRTGFGNNLFDAWRYLDVGDPSKPTAVRRTNPDFILNQARYQGATVLVAGRNFGCGSSREHAPWALQQYGFRALIAPSFADIFFNNCYKNGLLPVVASPEIVERIMDAAKSLSDYRIVVDLPQQILIFPEGDSVAFEVTPHRKNSLLHGLDDIGITLKEADKIRAFEAVYRQQHPYFFNP